MDLRISPLESGRFELQAVLPLEQAPPAQALSQQGHTQGKIMLRIAA